MKVFQTDENRYAPRVVVLGTFDGVHRGHQKLLAIGGALKEEAYAKLRVCTFDRHPLTVLRPEAAPTLITSIPEKARMMRLYGADEMQLIPFTRRLANLSPEEFLQRLRGSTRLLAVVAGWNYSFGRGGAGTAETLIRDGERHGYAVRIVPPVTIEGGDRVVSSSAVREAVTSGDLHLAAIMLGRFPEFGGIAEQPAGSAESSIRLRSRLLPPDGIYRSRIRFSGERESERRVIRLENGHATPEDQPGFRRAAGEKCRLILEGRL